MNSFVFIACGVQGPDNFSIDYEVIYFQLDNHKNGKK